MSQAPVRWDVYLFFCQQAKPEPKDKFVVIVYAETDWFYGFFINSEIKQFITKRNLQLCMAPVAQSVHTFLNRDSWVDCTGAYTFPNSILTPTTHRGTLDESAITAVLGAVRVCPRIRKRQQELILLP